MLVQLRRALGGLEPALLAPAIRALERIQLRLQRPLRVAIAGEFNSGKSSLANLIAGVDSLPTAILSSTRIPTLLCYEARPQVWALDFDGRREPLRDDSTPPQQSIFRLEVGLPSPQLRTLQVLDLPGLADPRFHSSLGDLTFHGADAVIWCTVATQAWKESERAAWEDQVATRLRDRGILVATHCDLLRDQADRNRLLERLRNVAGSDFDAIAGLSTIEALAAAQDGGDDAANWPIWETSGAKAVRDALAHLAWRVRRERDGAARQVAVRIARHALARLEQLDQSIQSGPQ
jgi:hypothetical protein